METPTPLEPRVRETMLRYFTEDFGNEGSRTHEFGARAKQAVQRARDQIASVVQCEREEVIFTSGATEANNLAIFGLASYARTANLRHIVTTSIEHKAVLEPIAELERQGFEVTRIRPDTEGAISSDALGAALRPDTFLVSVMHANNETGVVQPIREIANLLKGHRAFFHVDAAQSFGKIIAELQDKRIDLTSISAHKIYGPKGIGALIVRRRGFDRVPLTPLMMGGGQERGLRPGTLPVPLIAGLGEAAAIASIDWKAREDKCGQFKKTLLESIQGLAPRFHGIPSKTMQHVVNLAIDGVDSEALMVALKGMIAISNGSACTSASYKPSHVLLEMGLSEDEIRGSVRISWCHMTPPVDWAPIIDSIRGLVIN